MVPHFYGHMSLKYSNITSTSVYFRLLDQIEIFTISAKFLLVQKIRHFYFEFKSSVLMD